jgi:hypothetical protein
LCLLAGVAGWAALATRAAAADGMEWQFFQADDPGYKTTPGYGVPGPTMCGERRMRAQLKRERKFLPSSPSRRYQRS